MCGVTDNPPDTVQHTMKKVLKFLAPFAVFSMGVAPAGDCSVADVKAMVADDNSQSTGCTAISPPSTASPVHRIHVLPASALSFQALDHTRMNCDKSCVTDVSSWYGRRQHVRLRCDGGTDLR